VEEGEGWRKEGKKGRKRREGWRRRHVVGVE